MQFYTYVWYDQDWIPYYVGKGVGCRSRRRRDIPHPEEGHCVLKYFDYEEEAFEHEKALIAFWGRRDYEDDGLLMNRSTGGKSPMKGARQTEKQKAAARNWHKKAPKQWFRDRALKANAALTAEQLHARGIKAGKKLQKGLIVSYKGTTEIFVPNISQFCRDAGIQNGNLYKVLNGQIKQTGGWTARYA